jgi:hypothetical protein
VGKRTAPILLEDLRITMRIPLQIVFLVYLLVEGL